MKDECLAVKISFPGSDLAGATICLEDWQARELKARVDKHNRWLRSQGRPEDYTMAHAIHSALEMCFKDPEEKESPEAATSRGLKE